MKRIIFIKALFLLSLATYAQTKSIDLNAIKNIANTDAYNVLFNRYVNNDTTLSIDDYGILYYGQAFKRNLVLYAMNDSARVLNTYLRNNKGAIDFHKVLDLSKHIVKDEPFNIDKIYYTAIAFDKIGAKDSSDIWFNRYDKLIRAILSSGNGKSVKSAIIVTKVSDEYSILNALELKFESQSLIQKKKKYYDLMNVSQNDSGIDKLYFDINLFYGKW